VAALALGALAAGTPPPLPQAQAEAAAAAAAVHGLGRRPLHYAVLGPAPAACVELVVQNGGDVNGIDVCGRTPLHLLADANEDWDEHARSQAASVRG
jgi:hypothetical protein